MLRFVKHHATPLHLIQEVLVARHQGIGTHHHIDSLRQLHEALALGAFQSVMHMHHQLWRKAEKFTVPVTQHAHGRHQQCWPNAFALWGHLSFSLQQGNQLDGLTETHVVGEACAHSIALQERQPADAGALVRTEGALESFRLLQERHLLNRIIGSEDFRHPSLGVDANHWQSTIGSIQVRHAQGFHKGCLTVGVLLQELDATLQIFRTDFYPATVDAHQRHALLGERLEFLKGEWRISQCNLPAVIDQTVQADSAVRLAAFATLARGRFAIDEQSCTHAVGGLAPPIRR